MDVDAIETQLGELETRIDRLRALYEQYFMGIEKMEPQVPRKEVERRLQVLTREQIRNTALRFKFRTLVQRYNTMQQYWMRVTREMENGTYRRDVLRAARRFGEKEALTILGKRRAKQYAVLADAQQERADEKKHDVEEMEVDVDDLVEDEQPAAPAPPPVAAASLPGIVRPAGLPTPSRAPPPLPPRSIPAPPMIGAPPVPSRPSLAPRPNARMTSTAPPLDLLNLDFDDVRASRPPPPITNGRAAHGIVGALDAPFGDDDARELGAPRTVVPAMPRLPERDMLPGRSGSFDVNFQPPGPTTRRPSSPSIRAVIAAPAPLSQRPSSPPGPSGRPPGTPNPPPRMTPVPGEIRVAVPPSPSVPPRGQVEEGTLPEQRIRQIYAKYVEAKRAAHESTAGVTYEKLAASLRAQSVKLREAHPAKSVDYDVVLKDGKAHLKPILR